MVPHLHLRVAFGALGVQLRCQTTIEERDQHITEVATSSHPLEVAPAVVVIRPVQLAAREGLLDPMEQRSMSHVHPQCYLRLATIPAKVTFTDQQTDQHTLFELCRQPSPPFGPTR